MKINKFFRDVLLAVMIICTPLAYGAEMQWYLLTNTGLSFEMKEVKALTASDNELTFNVIGHNGSILAQNVDKVKFRYALSAPKLGDANGDNQVNLTDMMHISSLILETFSGECDLESADVNFDDVVNVADIVATSNIITKGYTTYNNDNADAQSGGIGWFLASYTLEGNKQLYSAKGINFVRDAETGQYAWQPTEKKLSDYASLGETYDIKNVKNFVRYMDSNNQFTVDLPQNASISQDEIIVKAYGEELTPTEDQHYSTVANVVSVTNAEGKMLYECYASLDNVNGVREVEINALETAYTMLIPIFPSVFDSTPDQILSTIKSLLAELPETHALAEAIDRSIVKNGYLEMDDIDAEYTAAVEKIIEKLGLRDNYLSDKKAASRGNGSQLKSPYVLDEYSFWGLRLVMNSSEYRRDIVQTPFWKCNFTAYNSNSFAHTAWLKGYKVNNDYATFYDGKDPKEYLGHILKPQKVSTFMGTFTSWEGLKGFFSDSYDLIVKDDFWFDDMTWDKTKLDFDMDFTSEKDVVIVAGPADNQFMLYYNILKVVLAPLVEGLTKGLNKMASIETNGQSELYESEYLIPFISDLLADIDYQLQFQVIYEGDGSWGYKAAQIVELTWPKFKKYLEKFAEEQANLIAERAIMKTFGFFTAANLRRAMEDISKNWNKYLKIEEKIGDAVMGYLGLQETSGYYDLFLDFEPAVPLKLGRNSITLDAGAKGYIPIVSGNGDYVISYISDHNVATASIEAVGSSKKGTDYAVKINAVGKGFCNIKVLDSRWKEFTIDVEVNFNSYTSCPDENHPHMIDLGLPSGTLWACCNVGASKPGDYGGYYAFGETEEKDVYDWSTYIYCDGTFDTCHDIGTEISGTEYDVATVKWSPLWRMPTFDDFLELKNNVDFDQAKPNGIKGSKCIGSNGGTIFLPEGDYWTSNVETRIYYGVAGFEVSYGSWCYSYAYRYCGRFVRPVIKK